jgi:hypothetical protein
MIKDYTLAQDAPIQEADKLPVGISAKQMNRVGQIYYQQTYPGPRPEYIHTLSSRYSNGPWYFAGIRQDLVLRYPKDKLVFIQHSKETREPIGFLGWLFFKDVSAKWISATTEGGMDLYSALYPMTTFNPAIDENKV